MGIFHGEFENLPTNLGPWFIAISGSLHFWQPINGWFGWVPGGAFIYIRENYAKRLQLISTLALGTVELC